MSSKEHGVMFKIATAWAVVAGVVVGLFATSKVVGKVRETHPVEKLKAPVEKLKARRQARALEHEERNDV